MDINGIVISEWIAKLGIWPLIVLLVPNLMFRRYGQSAGKKRMSSLFQAIAVFLITTMAAFIVERELSDKYLFIGIAAVAVLLYVFRERVFPYRLSCIECDARLDFKTIYFMDDNLCTDCHSKKVAREEAAEEKVAESANEGNSEETESDEISSDETPQIESEDGDD